MIARASFDAPRFVDESSARRGVPVEVTLEPWRVPLDVTFAVARRRRLAKPSFLAVTSPTSSRVRILGAPRTRTNRHPVHRRVLRAEVRGRVIACEELAVATGTPRRRTRGTAPGRARSRCAPHGESSRVAVGPGGRLVGAVARPRLVSVAGGAIGNRALAVCVINLVRRCRTRHRTLVATRSRRRRCASRATLPRPRGRHAGRRRGYARGSRSVGAHRIGHDPHHRLSG